MHYSHTQKYQKVISERTIKNIINMKLVQITTLTTTDHGEGIILPNFYDQKEYEIRYTYKGIATTKEQIINLLRQEICQNQVSAQVLRNRAYILKNSKKEQLIKQLSQQLQNLEEQKKNQLQNYRQSKKNYNNNMSEINKEKRQIKEQIAYMANVKKRQRDIKQFENNLSTRHQREIQQKEHMLEKLLQESRQKRNELWQHQSKINQVEGQYNRLVEYNSQQIDAYKRQLQMKEQSIRRYDAESKQAESLLKDPVRLNIQNIKNNVKNSKTVMASLKKLGELYKMPQREHSASQNTSNLYQWMRK